MMALRRRNAENYSKQEARSSIDSTDESNRHCILIPTGAVYTVNSSDQNEVDLMKFTQLRFPIRSAAVAKSQHQQRRWQILQQLWQQLWQSLLNQLRAEEPEFRVWTTHDRAGEIWWSAENVRTGRSIAEVSENQVRSWLEKQLTSGTNDGV